MSAAAAELLRQTLDRIASEQARLERAADCVRAALVWFGEDPEQPSRAELEEFRLAGSPVPEVSVGADPIAPVVGETASPPVVSPTALGSLVRRVGA